MLYLGRLGAAREESAENTLTAPNGKSRTLKTVLSRCFPVRKTVRKVGFSVSGTGTGKTGSTVGMFFSLFRKLTEAENSSFLDGKRRFLTAFGGILSVLFGVGIRSSRDRIPSCSGTPFWPVLARSALFHPLEPSKAVRNLSESGRKVACFEPFYHLLTRKTCFLSLSVCLLSV